MRPRNQEQIQRINVTKNLNPRNNITISNQSNTYKYQPNSQTMNQKGTFYTSGQTNKPSDLNKKITYSSNLPEEKAFKYSTISNQGNQRYSQQQNTINQIGPRIEKKIYVNQGKANNTNINTNTNTSTEKNNLASLISSAESYSNININKSKNDFNSRKMDRNKNNNENRNIRGRRIEESDINHNRARSYITQRQPKNKLAPPEKSLKEKNQAHSVEIKRKVVYRGGKYNNIKVTHIISTIKPNINKYKFHIFENLSRVELDKKPLDLSKIKSQIKQNDKAKSSFKSSCDGRIINPINRVKVPKTTFYQHAAGIGMTDLDPK